MSDTSDPKAAPSEARLFDGICARGERVRVEAAGSFGWVLHREDGTYETLPLDHLRRGDDADASSRVLLLADGRQLHFYAPHAHAVRHDDLSPMSRWIREPHRAWWSALALLVVPALLLTLVIPAVVNVLAPMIPRSVETRLGEAVLTSLRKSSLKPTQLSDETQARLTTRFQTLARESGIPEARLEFGRWIPNAFALPGGTVILTDEIVYLLGDDDRLAGVMAHELGHLHHRHSLRGLATYLLGTQLLTVAMSQDQLSTKVVDLVAGNVLAAKNSQAAEREADRYGCELLAKTKQSPVHLAEGLERLRSMVRRANVDPDSGGFTSSHPAISERVADMRACAERHGFAR